VIDWRWESGSTRLDIDDLIIPGTEKISSLLLSKVNNFSLQALTIYKPDYLAGYLAQAYDVALEEAWDQGRKVMREQTRSACVNQASTHRIRNFTMEMDFSDESWRYILLPLYLASYKYENVDYQIVVNGQVGSISGQRPVDWRKVWLIVGGILTPGILLCGIGLLTIAFGIGIVIGIFGFLLLIAGIVGAFFILRKAYSLDDI
jgi:hypothetical protein